MANTFLTPNMITREALRILHQKLTFVGNINRAYDDSFANEGARIGSALRIRLPNQYTVRSGATLSTQDTAENSVTLNVTTQKGVDINFTSADLTLQLDDFSTRILQPAMAVLAASVENDALTMSNSVYNVVNNIGSAITFRQMLLARKALQDNLTPVGPDRAVILNTQDNVDMVDVLKGLFQDSGSLAKQYRDGLLGHTAGFDFYESTLIASTTTGTAASATTYTVNGASQTGATVTVATGATTFAVGDVVTFAGCFSVHPETKISTNNLQQFVVTAAYAGGGGNLAISPSIVVSVATQNVSASPTNGGAVRIAGLQAVAGVPQGRLHLRNRRPDHAEGCGHGRTVCAGRPEPAHGSPVRYQQRQVPLPSRYPIRLPGHPPAACGAHPLQLIQAGGASAPPFLAEDVMDFAEFPKQLYGDGWADLSVTIVVNNAEEEATDRKAGFRYIWEDGPMLNPPKPEPPRIVELPDA
jgi:hypothetical protein